VVLLDVGRRGVPVLFTGGHDLVGGDREGRIGDVKVRDGLVAVTLMGVPGARVGRTPRIL